MKKIILIVLAVFIFSGIGYAQRSELTDRELLIQLIEKVNYINDSVTRIEKNFGSISDKIYILESRVTVTEQSIISLLERIKDLASTWNWLLGLFSAFVGGIFIWIWKGVYGNRKKNNKVN